VQGEKVDGAGIGLAKRRFVGQGAWGVRVRRNKVKCGFDAGVGGWVFFKCLSCVASTK